MLNGASFELSTGEIFGIFGRNGCGKSTLLKSMFGTQNATVSIQVDGKELSQKDVIASGLVAYLPQHAFIPSSLLVRDSIPMYHPEESKQDAIFYDPTIARIAHRKIGELSHGERKYLETLLIGQLSHPFLFLDEPFSMLEPLQIERIKERIVEFSSTKGIIITDHYYRDVWDIASKKAVMKDGILHPVAEFEDLQRFDYLAEKQR